MTNEIRTNLKDYYKFVKKCIICHLEYGSDVKREEVKDTCPVCIGKLNHYSTGTTRWHNE